MYRSWHSLIRPALLAADARTVVEIGSGGGDTTRHLLDYVAEVGGRLDVIDPAPSYDARQLRAGPGSQYVYHRERSLEALRDLRKADAVLVDGDHNWYTVVNELRLLLGGRVRDSRGQLPLILLHDIDWPYARRDLYYDPNDVPSAERQPFARGGMVPGQSALQADAFNLDYHHAVHEGGPANGVRTAVEDALAELPDLEFVDVPGFHGLGIIASPSRWRGELRNFRFLLDDADFLRARLTDVEQGRLEALVLACRYRTRANRMDKRIAELEAEIARLASGAVRNVRFVATPGTVLISLPDDAAPMATIPELPPMTVIVPIFNAYDEARACLDSVIRHSEGEYRVVLVDDASTDPRIAPFLAAFAADHSRVEVLTSSDNRGFAGAVNVGLAKSSGDVVLLNSDTVVTAGWNTRLAHVAYQQPDVATVTPVTNAAGAFSVPGDNVDEELPPHISPDTMAQLVDRLSERVRPDSPTGCGFCMYITRQALDAVPTLDEAAFPRGYGEENDFCFQLRALGFHHVIDDATFVYHRGAASFGPQPELKREGRRRLLERFPEYDEWVADLVERDALGPLRRSLRTVTSSPASVAAALGPLPVLLIVGAHGSGPGLAPTGELAASLSSSFDVLLLDCDDREWTLSRCFGHEIQAIERVAFEEPWSPEAGASADRATALVELVVRHGVSSVQVDDLRWTGPEAVEAVIAAGTPCVLSFRDFLPVCPRSDLRDELQRSCEGSCTDSVGGCEARHPSMRDTPELKHQWVHDWRQRCGRLASRCAGVIAVAGRQAEITRERLRIPAVVPLHIVRPGHNAFGFTVAGSPAEGGRVRVFATGEPESEGPSFLVAMLGCDTGQLLELHVAGPTAREQELRSLGAIVHVPTDAPVQHLLAQVRPAWWLITPTNGDVCTELTQARIARVPVLTDDHPLLRGEALPGAIRLRTPDQQGWYELLTHTDKKEWQRLYDETRGFPCRTADDVAADLRRIHRGVLTEAR